MAKKNFVSGGLSQGSLSESSPLYADSSVLINNPNSLLDDSVRYEDTVQIKRFHVDDPHFLLFTYSGFVNAGATDVYGAVAFLVDIKTRIMYHYAICSYVCLVGAGIEEEILARVTPQTSLIDGVYHFQTLGNAAPVPGASDWSIMLDFIIANDYRYSWFKPINQKSYDFAQDINDNPILSPYFKNQGAQGVWLVRYEFIKPMRKVISTVTKSYKYAPYAYSYPSNSELSIEEEDDLVDDFFTDTQGNEDLSDFAKATGITATQFNNLFVNVPRNARVNTQITDWCWNTVGATGLKVIVFEISFPANQINIESIRFNMQNLRVLIVAPIGNFIQYDKLPPRDKNSELAAVDFIRKKFAGTIWRGLDVASPANSTTVDHIDTMNSDLKDYMYGRITVFELIRRSKPIKTAWRSYFNRDD